jgi:hypothetical protein
LKSVGTRVTIWSLISNDLLVLEKQLHYHDVRKRITARVILNIKINKEESKIIIWDGLPEVNRLFMMHPSVSLITLEQNARFLKSH